MIELIETLNFYLALGGVVLLLGAVVLVYDFFTSKSLKGLLEMWGLFVAFILTSISSVMTLVYSEVFGFPPCGLCWLQRVFLYPQVFILGVALYYKDKTAARYGIALSVPGFIVGVYQHYLQMGGSELVKCPAAISADCAKRILFEFGFMTFPLLSASIFIFLIVLYLYILKIRD